MNRNPIGKPSRGVDRNVDRNPQPGEKSGAKRRSVRAALATLLTMLGLAAGCAVGPRYQRPAATAPAAALPSAWKTEAPWQPASPKDAIPKGAWWQVFHDPTLDAYEQQLLQANQSLLAARDRLAQARSQARVATSALFPQTSIDPGAVHQGAGANRPLNGAQPPATPYIQDVFTVPFSVSYEADLFGAVRHTVEAANATLQSSAANLQNTQLVLGAELAADYFAVRESDTELQVVEELVGYERKGMELVNNRHDGGIANGLEVAQQAALLDGTLTQLALVRQTRAQFEHAIAALLGTPAPNFSVAASPLQATPPALPLGVPSDVLERRPDIASAERQIAYANAQVGIAKAAFYPHITLGGIGGWQSRDIATLANAPSLYWSIGADALQPIFQGGRNRANLAAARSAYDASVADYRQSVLTAFQQVEDGISDQQTLAQASTTQAAAVKDARRQLYIANNRYVGGLTTYLDVITAQSTLLANERLAVQLLGQQMVSSVYLVKALGGGWQASDLNSLPVHPQAKQLLQP
jgi:NodT family efflux transporter outer membrane factor (OMF) lipoprotein